ncbi:MAG: YcgL domain-containing protein [Alkalimonas sp.]|uniref:YcgL domain-containing protein Q3O59_11340 n=1 Tax=Alkalimonas delamerensis TaxID=265981 RepID=A0ABT9GRU6_9GAMM|nr:YcgL domain-containing protein [Alkalimonas delamerensis]MCC5852528.1 YcgL domain-containing protein [Alkalimonas sp.]MDP4529614.1 YcgL domain-containing protein [Alkalimonas delamerensis]
MLCVVYKSLKKEQTYLYIERRDDFSNVPEALLATFGTPQLVTLIDLNKRTSLAQADLSKVKAALTEQGYYLQLPPPPEDLLAEHKALLQSKS